MTIRAELDNIRERAIRATPNGDDKYPGAYLADVFEMYDITRNTVPRLLDAVEAVMREVGYAPESNDYLEDWERGHRAALIQIGRVVTTALEGK